MEKVLGSNKISHFTEPVDKSVISYNIRIDLPINHITQQFFSITPSTKATKPIYHYIVSLNIRLNTFLVHFTEEILSIAMMSVFAKTINDGVIDYKIGFDVALVHLPKQRQGSQCRPSYTFHLQLFRK
ncbi:PREDICTED: LOW QUALITY PROTEIN: uncharacterized protein LOC109128188 [Camelina sativa]|uniref:LOW QUALITY PROTEIN: uncharacterized protein LOC109128188 n=1 Tax=Camelina sativa TaxID=90675 RepID=A0ABM1QSB9_CAMSA|nr:PREDICTED: LOW QUALITY PROTEIN: uncharacterized protein LOC109128188 [Camelina sativa]